jgi:hypothetical protein
VILNFHSIHLIFKRNVPSTTFVQHSKKKEINKDICLLIVIELQKMLYVSSFITTAVVTDVNHWLDGFRTGEQIAATHGARILLRGAEGGFGIFLLNMHAYISSLSSFKNSIVIKKLVV